MPPVERPSKRSSALRAVEMFLWAAGLILLGWVGFVWADGALYQMRAEARLEAAAASASSQAEAPLTADTAASTNRTPAPAERPARLPGEDDAPEPTGTTARGSETAEPAPPAAVSDPLGRLEIPRLGLSVVVAEGTTSRVLNRAVGHVRSTPLPGTYGNSALAGHRDRHFRPLESIRPGDEIVYTAPSGTVRYRVEWTEVVPPDALRVLDPTDERSLTLITCHPFDYVGSAPNRFIVRAREIAPQTGSPLRGS